MSVVRVTAAVLAALVLTGPALAHDVKLGALEIQHPWARATAPSAPTGAVYLALGNDSQQADRLVSAASPVAGKVELHTHLMDNGTAMMREVKAIDLPSEGSVTLAPGGLHIMLIGLKEPLVKGKTFPLTLTFETAGSVTVEVAIQGPGAMAPEEEGKSDHQP